MRNGKATLERMRGRFIGEYAKPKSKIKYEYEKSIAKINLTVGELFTKNRNTAMEFTIAKWLEKGKKTKPKHMIIPEEKSPCKGFSIYQNPVHKPYNFGPFTQCENPMMEKIIYKGEIIYLGIINDKLATFSVSYDNGKKQMILHNLKKITKEQNNRDYLKNTAKNTLDNLISKVDAYQINWPNLKNCEIRRVA